MLKSWLKSSHKPSRGTVSLRSPISRDVGMVAITYAACLTTPIVFGIEQQVRLGGLNIFLLICDLCFGVDFFYFLRQNKDLLKGRRLIKGPPSRVIFDFFVHISSVLCLFLQPTFLILGFNGRALAWMSVFRMVRNVV